MDTSKKIRIDSHGISPWHYFLESMSWGFSRARNEDDKMASFKVDPGWVNDGGRGLEDVLMADFLQSLSFAGDDFVSAVAARSGMSDLHLRSCEIKGNAGNYFIPYENREEGIRLAQPDGWIADENTLILLEAKGYRQNASLNEGQLAKEYLIAQNVAQHCGKKNFYILLIVNKTEDIYKSGCTKFDLSEDSFKDLWGANIDDLAKSRGMFLKEQLSKDGGISWDDLLATEKTWTEVRNHFRWITWNEIAALTDQFKDDPVTEQIGKSIRFHSSEKEDDWPIFSKFLAEIAREGVKLCRFYNGGCGNDILQDFEEQYWKEIGRTGPTPWQDWHALKQSNAELMEELEKLDEQRCNALVGLREAEKNIRNFYDKKLHVSRAPRTTRLAFEMLGESSQLESVENSFFTQRMSIKKDQFQEK